MNKTVDAVHASVTQFTGIVSNQLFNTLRIAIEDTDCFLCVLGTITNSLNLYVFSKIGFKDHITLCFFSLSVSDLSAICTMLTINSIGGLSEIIQIATVSVSELQLFLVYYYRMFYDISVVTTTFVAFQRGCCVAFPFYFKDVFTKKLNLITLIVIYISVFTVYTPLFSTSWLIQKTELETNRSYVGLYFNDQRSKALAVADIFSNIFGVFTGQTIVFVSLALINYGMRSSLKFRSSWGPSKFGEERSEDKVTEYYKNEPGVASTSIPKNETHQHKGNRKELKVVHQVAFLSTAYVVSNFPNTVWSVTKLTVPGFSFQGRYGNLYWISNGFINIVELLNCSVNFFIYVKFNSKFRMILLATLQQIRKSLVTRENKDIVTEN